MKNNNTLGLGSHFNFKNLLRFTVPTIFMMIFSSVYGVVDGLFVSNFAGKTPFAAVNFIMPYIMIASTGGFMLGTGGNAYISKLLGEGQKEKARKIFSFVIYTTIVAGILLTIITELALRSVAGLMGAEGEMLELAVEYGRLVIMGTVFFMLQTEFQSFWNTAEKPKFGMFVTILAGVTNIIMDILFIGVMGMGVRGAAYATVLSMVIGGMVPILYFTFNKTGDLYFVPAGFDGRALGKICLNGSSEMVTNISISLVSMLYNIQLLKFSGEDGVAAYGVIMYVNMIFLSTFIGYAVGVAPIVGFHFGAKNFDELKSLLKKSAVIIGIFAVSMLLASQLLAAPLTGFFTKYDKDLYELTEHAFRIYSISFLLSGISIFTSSFFTALSNGRVSAMISFLRTMVYETLSVILVPLIFGIEGIWVSIIVAETLSTITSLSLLFKYKNKYYYI